MLAGQDPYQLPFVVNEGYYAPLTGTYRTYMNTVEARVRRQNDFLSVTFSTDDYRSVTTALAPDIIGRDYCRFYTVAFGSRMNVEFFIRREWSGGTAVRTLSAAEGRPMTAAQIDQIAHDLIAETDIGREDAPRRTIDDELACMFPA